MKKILAAVLLFSFLSPSWADSPLPMQSYVPTTITSDVMELKQHGQLTVFEGHVILIQEPYHVTANKMVQHKDTGIVDLNGNVVGTWSSIKGDRAEATGDQASYNPSTQVLQLWGTPKLTRWANDKDPQPMIVTANLFIANEPNSTVWAVHNVHIVQGDRLDTHSDQACYHTKLQILALGGPGRVSIHINDGKGQGDFHSDSAWMTLDPRHAQLIDHVIGHVIPAPR